MPRTTLDISRDISKADQAFAKRLSQSRVTGDPHPKSLSKVEVRRAWERADRYGSADIERLVRFSAQLGVPVPRDYGPDRAAGVLGDTPRDPRSGKQLRRTRLINTIGPASDSVPVLVEMIKAGMDIARINFSHVRTFEEAEQRVRNLAAAMTIAGRKVQILADLQGPKVRIGELDSPVEVKKGQTVTFYASPGGAQPAPGRIPINNAPLVADLQVGNRVLIDDGKVELVVTAARGEEREARVVRGGPIGSRKGINLPDTKLTERVPTVEDRKSIDIINRLVIDGRPAIDLFAVSFVESGEDMDRVRAAIGRQAWLMAKIERPIALEKKNLRSILERSDAAMVARGDLFIELGQERGPHAQDRILAAAFGAQVPAGTATMMLESMTAGGPPTRAEVNDVADAVYDGAAFVMTSGETAVGKDPVLVVETMNALVCRAERDLKMGPRRRR